MNAGVGGIQLLRHAQSDRLQEERLAEAGKQDEDQWHCVETLVERSVKECVSHIAAGQLHPGHALESVASLLVAELSADQVGADQACWAPVRRSGGLV